MIMHLPNKPFLIALGFLSVFPAISWAAGAGATTAPDADSVILVADDPNSVATIDGPWDLPMTIRVVTLSDEPLLSGLSGADRDPSKPIRVATAIRHPDGEIVQINLFEVAQRILVIKTRRGFRQYMDWVVNTELPFTREAELQAAIEGFDIHRSAGRGKRGSLEASRDSVCWLTGEHIVQVPVLFDPERSAVVNYGIQIVSVRDPGVLMSSNDDGPGPDENDGGDPAGNPDQPPLTSGDSDKEGDPDDDPLEGGDPGGNPDPPTQEFD
ncbi:MAG: hypothetical protein V3W34_18120 [Phycisphaerae bacterium]